MIYSVNTMDKRDLASEFRRRIGILIDRSGMSRAKFARCLKIDRSALSQLLDGDSTRLPRAETLLAIAQVSQVSLDWLLGLSQDEGLTGQLRASVEIEEGPGDFDRTLLARWHAEAIGTKIRYVPAGIPDLLRTPAIIGYESFGRQRSSASILDEARFRIDYNRRPETDMEVCMPRQTLDLLAAGQGMWARLDPDQRATWMKNFERIRDKWQPGPLVPTAAELSGQLEGAASL